MVYSLCEDNFGEYMACGLLARLDACHKEDEHSTKQKLISQSCLNQMKNTDHHYECHSEYANHPCVSQFNHVTNADFFEGNHTLVYPFKYRLVGNL